MRALAMRRNVIKLALYRHFTNVLSMALFVAVIYMLWSLYMHLWQECMSSFIDQPSLSNHYFILGMSDWKELWVDTAFWHFFFCTLLVVIMFLWRPSQNNQRYAFTPLLDNSEDEAEDDDTDRMDEENELYRAGVFEMVQKRSTQSSSKPSPGNQDAKIKVCRRYVLSRM